MKDLEGEKKVKLEAYALAEHGDNAHLLSLALGASGGSEPNSLTQGQCSIRVKHNITLPRVPCFLRHQFIDHPVRKGEQLGVLHKDCLGF